MPPAQCGTLAHSSPFRPPCLLDEPSYILKCITKALEIEPGYRDAVIQKSVVEFDVLMEEGCRCWKEHFDDDAVEAFKKALKINPNSVEARKCLKDCQTATGEDEEAGTATANGSQNKNKRRVK